MTAAEFANTDPKKFEAHELTVQYTVAQSMGLYTLDNTGEKVYDYKCIYVTSPRPAGNQIVIPSMSLLATSRGSVDVKYTVRIAIGIGSGAQFTSTADAYSKTTTSLNAAIKSQNFTKNFQANAVHAYNITGATGFNPLVGSTSTTLPTASTPRVVVAGSTPSPSPGPLDVGQPGYYAIIVCLCLVLPVLVVLSVILLAMNGVIYIDGLSPKDLSTSEEFVAVDNGEYPSNSYTNSGYEQFEIDVNGNNGNEKEIVVVESQYGRGTRL